MPTTFESEIEGTARGEHLLAIRGDTGTRMTTYRSTIRGWADAASVTASAYKIFIYFFARCRVYSSHGVYYVASVASLCGL